MWAVMQELAVAAPQMLLYCLALFVAMFVMTVVIALRKTQASERPEIIRALADLMAFWRRK
jgi:type III secretory pathway component EscR